MVGKNTESDEEKRFEFLFKRCLTPASLHQACLKVFSLKLVVEKFFLAANL